MTDLRDFIDRSRRPARRLSELVPGGGHLMGDARVTELCDDSRRVREGEAFLLMPRAAERAPEFIREAEARGATALVLVGHVPYGGELPLLRLHRMEQLGALLRRWFGTEQTRVRLVGITGTDGKTSVTWMLREALERRYGRAWAVGTLGWVRRNDEIVDLGNTTPSLLTMHRLLAAADVEGVEALAAEVSSHGIEQQRIAGLPFRAAVWTNLGHDHLQDHGGLETYARIKQGFVDATLAGGGAAICNADDPEVRRRIADGAAWYGHGLYRKELTLAWEQELPGMVRLRTGGTEIRVEEAPLGEFHAENLAATALALIEGFGVDAEALPKLLAGLSAPPGRLQDLSSGHWQVFVDYAHTPEALERTLNSVRTLTHNRLLLVFGCGGERDRGKRPRMGLIAATCADAVWITSDNPRGEPPEVIASEIENGMPRPYPAEVHLQLDRHAAIAEAIAAMGDGDTLLIAGKGHEDYMELDGRRTPWSDATVARECLESKHDAMDRRACA